MAQTKMSRRTRLLVLLLAVRMAAGKLNVTLVAFASRNCTGPPTYYNVFADDCVVLAAPYGPPAALTILSCNAPADPSVSAVFFGDAGGACTGDAQQWRIPLQTCFDTGFSSLSLPAGCAEMPTPTNTPTPSSSSPASVTLVLYSDQDCNSAPVGNYTVIPCLLKGCNSPYVCTNLLPANKAVRGYYCDEGGAFLYFSSVSSTPGVCWDTGPNPRLYAAPIDGHCMTIPSSGGWGIRIPTGCAGKGWPQRPLISSTPSPSSPPLIVSASVFSSSRDCSSGGAQVTLGRYVCTPAASAGGIVGVALQSCDVGGNATLRVWASPSCASGGASYSWTFPADTSCFDAGVLGSANLPLGATCGAIHPSGVSFTPAPSSSPAPHGMLVSFHDDRACRGAVRNVTLPSARKCTEVNGVSYSAINCLAKAINVAVLPKTDCSGLSSKNYGFHVTNPTLSTCVDLIYASLSFPTMCDNWVERSDNDNGWKGDGVAFDVFGGGGRHAAAPLSVLLEVSPASRSCDPTAVPSAMNFTLSTGVCVPINVSNGVIGIVMEQCGGDDGNDAVFTAYASVTCSGSSGVPWAFPVDDKCFDAVVAGVRLPAGCTQASASPSPSITPSPSPSASVTASPHPTPSSTNTPALATIQLFHTSRTCGLVASSPSSYGSSGGASTWSDSGADGDGASVTMPDGEALPPVVNLTLRYDVCTSVATPRGQIGLKLGLCGIRSYDPIPYNDFYMAVISVYPNSSCKIPMAPASDGTWDWHPPLVGCFDTGWSSISLPVGCGIAPFYVTPTPTPTPAPGLLLWLYADRGCGDAPEKSLTLPFDSCVPVDVDGGMSLRLQLCGLTDAVIQYFSSGDCSGEPWQLLVPLNGDCADGVFAGVRAPHGCVPS